MAIRFSLQITMETGTIDGSLADSLSTVNYLKKIGNLRGKEVMKTSFDDKDPFATVTIGKLEGGEIKIESFALTQHLLRFTHQLTLRISLSIMMEALWKRYL